MLFDSTKTLLRSIVQALAENNETEWENHRLSAIECLFELHQTARSASRNYRSDANPKFRVAAPATEGALRAIPSVKLMAAAIRRRERVAAIESGRNAIAAMDGTSRSRLPVATTVPVIASVERKQAALQVKEPVKVVKAQKKASAGKRYSAGAKRTAVAKRRPKTRAATANS